MKVTIAIVLLGLLAIAANVNGAAISNDGAVDLGVALKLYYTSFKKIMPCGYPPNDMPIMAPFKLDFLPFDFGSGDYMTKGNISNFMLTGLDNYRIIDMSFDPASNRTSFDMIFPQLQILGEFEMDSSMVVFGYNAGSNGKGVLNWKLIDYRAVGSFVIGPSIANANGLEISDFDIHYYLGDAIANNWYNEWDIAFNNFYNRVWSDFIKSGTQFVQPFVSDLYTRYVLPNANEFLENISITDVINFLLDQTMQFNEANCQPLDN